jgi:hypothetical protein
MNEKNGSQDKFNEQVSESLGRLSTLMSAAIQMHELFMTLQGAGFTADESLKLLASLIKEN